ncbi:MAG: toxin-antitoxin system TumE family protein [Halococcoides sp.]
MAQEFPYQYTHVEAGLVENVRLRRTTDTEVYPSGWKYTLHLGTLEDLTLVRYDNAHEDTKGHELHTAAGDIHDVEFPGMEERLIEFWESADEYWHAVGGDPPRPY